MSIITQERIAEYKDAYYKLHGSYPRVSMNGSWIKINDSFSSYRSSDLPSMTRRIKNISEQRDDNNRIIEEKKKRDDYILDVLTKSKDHDYWETPVEKREVNIGKYSDIIRTDSVMLFLDKLYEKCGNSAFEMQSWFDNFGTDGDDSVISLKERIRDLEDARSNLHQKVSLLKKRKEVIQSDYTEYKRFHLREIGKLKERIKILQENSVLFSMDDLAEIVPKQPTKKRKRHKIEYGLPF